MFTINIRAIVLIILKTVIDVTMLFHQKQIMKNRILQYNTVIFYGIMQSNSTQVIAGLSKAAAENIYYFHHHSPVNSSQARSEVGAYSRQRKHPHQ